MPKAGDVLLCSTNDIVGRLIKFGQWWRYRGSVYCDYTHCAIFISDSELVEARPPHVIKSNYDIYRNSRHTVIALSNVSNDDVNHVIKFALSCLNHEYGWLDIISIALSILTGGKLTFSTNGNFICSQLVAEALCRVGVIWSKEPAAMMPADIARELNHVN